jgi:hypothetical protein
MSIDDLRALTPAGSISAMTHRQASDLLNRLNARTEYEHPRKTKRGPRRPKGVYRLATDAQRAKVESLRMYLGWTPDRLSEWLGERHHKDGRPMTRIDSSIDAVAVIELLKAVLGRVQSRRGGELDRQDDRNAPNTENDLSPALDAVATASGERLLT